MLVLQSNANCLQQHDALFSTVTSVPGPQPSCSLCMTLSNAEEYAEPKHAEPEMQSLGKHAESTTLAEHEPKR